MTRPAPSRWIDVDQSKYDHAESTSRHGVHFELFLSPYDMPEAVRGSYDRSQKRFVIQLKYIESEPVEAHEIDRFVTFFTGKRSQRLYRICVDVKALGAKEVALHLNQAIDHFTSESASAQPPRANLRVAKDILQDNESELLRPLLSV